MAALASLMILPLHLPCLVRTMSLAPYAFCIATYWQYQPSTHRPFSRLISILQWTALTPDTLAVSAQGFRRGANRVRKQMW